MCVCEGRPFPRMFVFFVKRRENICIDREKEMDFGGDCGNFPRLVCEIGIDFMDLSIIYMIIKLQKFLPR